MGYLSIQKAPKLTSGGGFLMELLTGFEPATY